jgi:hypothetical protein
MRPNLQDRSSFYPGPARKSADRESERLTDVIDTKTTGGGTVTFDVTGAVPTYAGVPAGVQQFYVAPLVRNSSIDMSASVLLEDGLGNLSFVQDTSNQFGTGTAAVVGKLDAASGAAIYNFASGSASSLAHGAASNQGGYRVGPTFAVSSPTGPTTTATVVVVQSGVPTVVTLTAPSGHTWLQAAGISSDGTKICALWTNTNSTGSGTAVIALHTTAGAISGSPTAAVSVARTAPSVAMVDGGKVVFAYNTFVYTADADTGAGSTLTLRASVGPTSRNNCANNITDDDYLFYASGNTLYRLNVSTGLTSTWPEVFRRFTGSPPTLSATTIPVSLHGIDMDRLVYGGNIIDVGGTNYYPLYSAIVLDGTGANVSDSVFTAYPNTNSNNVSVYALTRQSNGNVVLALRGDASSTRFLIQVSGP